MPSSPIVHIDLDVPRGAIVDALLAIERSASSGVYDQEQHDRLAPLVLGLREAIDATLADA
jgi:hypothetical protein